LRHTIKQARAEHGLLAKCLQICVVTCVIIGFGLREPDQRTIFDYSDNIKGDDARVIAAKSINPYLVDASDAVLVNRRAPICPVSQMVYGSKPTDGGHLLLSDEEKAHLLDNEPKAERWIRPFLGAEEFINGQSRWCLWFTRYLCD
jgi:hypothetical protein